MNSSKKKVVTLPSRLTMFEKVASSDKLITDTNFTKQMVILHNILAKYEQKVLSNKPCALTSLKEIDKNIICELKVDNNTNYNVLQEIIEGVSSDKKEDPSIEVLDDSNGSNIIIRLESKN